MRKAFMQGARYSGLSALFRPALSGVGAILMLHHVRPGQGGLGLNKLLEIEPAFLDRLLDELKQDARFVSMDEAADRLRRGHDDERYLAVTLDDGYRDNVEHAAPVFRAHGVPYTIFVCPGYADRSADLWWELADMIMEANDEVAFDTASGRKVFDCSTPALKHKAYAEFMQYAWTEIDEDAQRELVRGLCETYGIDRRAHSDASLLDWDELRALGDDPLATIGAHTVNHFMLARLTRERAAEEMARSRDLLGEQLGKRPSHLAYPYGFPAAVGQREVDIARELGFETCVTTRHGLLMPGHREAMQALPRVSVNGNYQHVSYVETMLTGITVPAANRGRRFVTV